ncbi:MAG: MarR family transcriptional regulator [Proteobacteria bacterium]|nr:MarR family transcriptional regulator [Pseudomonadota bacterium]
MTRPKKIKTDCHIFLLGKAYQRGHHLVQNRLKPYGLTNAQYVVLEVLWQEAGITAVKIGKLLRMDKASLSGILDRMAESGWILKQQDDRDLRMIRIYPSEKADGLKETLIEERRKANEELLSGFTVEEKVLLRRMLLDMV